MLVFLSFRIGIQYTIHDMYNSMFSDKIKIDFFLASFLRSFFRIAVFLTFYANRRIFTVFTFRLGSEVCNEHSVLIETSYRRGATNVYCIKAFNTRSFQFVRKLENKESIIQASCRIKFSILSRYQLKKNKTATTTKSTQRR